MTGLKEARLFQSFADKDYRDAFVEEHIGAGLARQIRAIREKKGWTQHELAERTSKAQETISQLENLDYGRYTLKTLRTLASAFDVALLVNFISFKELVERVANLAPENIAPPSYNEERQMSLAEAPGGSPDLNPPAPRMILIYSPNQIGDFAYDTLPDFPNTWGQWTNPSFGQWTASTNDYQITSIVNQPREEVQKYEPAVA